MGESTKRSVNPDIKQSPLMQGTGRRRQPLQTSPSYLKPFDEQTNGGESPVAEQGNQIATGNESAVAIQAATSARSLPKEINTLDMVRTNTPMPTSLKNALDAWAQSMRHQKSLARRQGVKRLSKETITASTIIRAVLETVLDRFDAEDFQLFDGEEELRAFFKDQLIRRPRNS